MLKRIGYYFGLTLVLSFTLFNGWVVLSGKSYFYKALIYTFADIDDYTIFENRTIPKSTHPISWTNAATYNTKPLPDSLQLYLKNIETVALVIIKNDSVVHESYYETYGIDSKSNSFSMAKSYVSALVGAAIKDGHIKNINQPIGDFLPEFKEGEKKKITIRHLLMMSSGLNWQEGYASPFSPTTEAYYGTDLPKLMYGLSPIEEPGKIFRYKSGDTQLLSFLLEKATHKNLSEYAFEKLWEPLGCEQEALWSLDKKEGVEKAYCCLNSNARDFAKLGKLYLDSGRYNNQQLLPLDFVLASIQPNHLPDGDLNMKPSEFYGYQWWTIPDYKGHFVFYARGILGQYIIVVPDTKTIVVRLGKKRGEAIGKHYKEIFLLLDEALSY